MRKNVVAVTLLVLALLGLGACAPVKGAAPACSLPTAREMVSAVNADRSKAGRVPVTLANDLTRIAQAWADNLAAGQVLYHSPESHRFYERRLSPTATFRGAAAENALGPSLGCIDAARMQALWMDSPAHEFNILAFDRRTIGFGVAVDAQGRMWAVQEFGF